MAVHWYSADVSWDFKISAVSDMAAITLSICSLFSVADKFWWLDKASYDGRFKLVKLIHHLDSPFTGPSAASSGDTLLVFSFARGTGGASPLSLFGIVYSFNIKKEKSK